MVDGDREKGGAERGFGEGQGRERRWGGSGRVGSGRGGAAGAGAEGGEWNIRIFKCALCAHRNRALAFFFFLLSPSARHSSRRRHSTRSDHAEPADRDARAAHEAICKQA